MKTSGAVRAVGQQLAAPSAASDEQRSAPAGAVALGRLPRRLGLIALAGVGLAWSSYRLSYAALEWFLLRVGEGKALVAVARDQGQ